MKPLATLQFSDFYPWAMRKQYPNLQYPGVYAIHISTETLTNHAFHWDLIHYIRMTTRSLHERLARFGYAVQHGERHSGGNTIFKEKGRIDTKYLHVAMMGIEHENLSQATYQRVLGKVVYLEYEAFAQFYEATEQDRPIFNKQ
ncbi:MAG: hypothetical protein AAF846_26685 [Chloroflexota bacterium]